VTDTPKDDTIEETVAEPGDAEPAAAPERRSRAQLVAFGVLPVLALVLALTAGYFKWQDSIVTRDESARAESMQAARDITVEMLSYQPATVDQQLAAAREKLTGEWKDAYGAMIDTEIVPVAKDKQVSAAASVAASASVSAEPDRAVVLLFVNQTVTVGTEQPTVTASSVRVTLDDVDGRWLISKFEPV